MADPEFFPAPRALTIAEIAELTGALPPDGVDVTRKISGLAALDAATPDDITFFENTRYAGALAATRAGACFCLARQKGQVPSATIPLTAARPHEAFTLIAEKLYPLAMRPRLVYGESGVSAMAHVHPQALLEPEVTIEAGVVVGPGAEIGRGARLLAGSVVGPNVRVGRETSVGPSAVVTHALIGDRVIIHAGVSIGQDGFGFIAGAAGHRKIVQIGRVIIQNDVEIGANTTVDRGSNRDTIIGEGTKIDNLCQIGHNVVLGRNCLVAGHVGISGSVTIGDGAILGGKVGVRDNVEIGRGAVIAASSSVGTDVPPGARWGGTPARPIKEWLRENATLRRLTRRPGQDKGDVSGGEDGEDTNE